MPTSRQCRLHRHNDIDTTTNDTTTPTQRTQRQTTQRHSTHPAQSQFCWRNLPCSSAGSLPACCLGCPKLGCYSNRKLCVVSQWTAPSILLSEAGSTCCRVVIGGKAAVNIPQPDFAFLGPLADPLATCRPTLLDPRPRGPPRPLGR